MPSSQVTEDYYLILEVAPTATLELINRSYKRLALKLHPDRNAKENATQAFQRLGQAYETLKDESLRRAYDVIYPSIKGTYTSPETTNTFRASPTSAPPSANPSEVEQIAALYRSQQERNTRWQARKHVFESSIFELQRNVRKLEQEIKNLDSIAAAEAVEEAQKNSWSAWLLSPLYRKVEDSEEEKARKDRAKQERKIEKDMKERRLDARKADLSKEENRLRQAREEVDAANSLDSRKIQTLQNRITARETRERQEKEKAAREEAAKWWEHWQRQQQEQLEKQKREAAEALRQRQEEARATAAAAAEQKRQQDQARQKQQQQQQQQQQQYSTPKCAHDGWWPKVQGRTACPECHDTWSYLLQCPSCTMRACPKCQAAIRPRKPRYTPKPSSYHYDDNDFY